MTGIAERPRISPLTARQLTELRTRLGAERDQTVHLIQSIEDEMGAFMDARRDTATDDEHDPEGPTLAFERSQASASLAQSELHVREIDSALDRIDEGSYGLCTTCHGPIKLPRLQVRPRAAQCIQCAERSR
ncbi:MAG TPA: TraR/DksA C4-type zinc finger protein [Galbitalea sp.]|nr:TraR/DksA C4-type zinc finger protein [Galbitalea sp.]